MKNLEIAERRLIEAIRMYDVHAMTFDHTIGRLIALGKLALLFKGNNDKSKAAVLI